MCGPASLDKDDQKWRAESDLRSLHGAAEVLGDPKRKKAALDVHMKNHQALMANLMGEEKQKAKSVGKTGKALDKHQKDTY